MELKLFVAETLKHIFDGIKAAQDYSKTVGGHVSPLHLPLRNDRGAVYSLDYRNDQEHMVEFDVVVTVADGAAMSGGVGVFVGPIGIGGKAKSESTSENVSRVRFSVPVVYPAQVENAVEKQ